MVFVYQTLSNDYHFCFDEADTMQTVKCTDNHSLADYEQIFAVNVRISHTYYLEYLEVFESLHQ